MLDIQSEDLGNKQNRIVYLTGGSELETAFSEKQQDDLYCLEDQSWWFRYRANVILVSQTSHLNKCLCTLKIQ